MTDNLYAFLLKLPKENLIHTMWEALDLMQQYNGRSRVFCIATALGAKENPEKEGNWKIPKLKEAKENTDCMGI